MLVAPAQARLSPATQLAKEIALTVWHNPCADVGIHIRRDLIYNDQGVDTTALGRAYVDRDRETGQIVLCQITVSKLWWLSPAAMCGLLIHETGHLAGWRAPPGQEYIHLYADGNGGVYGVREPTHHRDPRKIMHASLADYREAHGGRPPPRCEQAFGRRFAWRRI